MHHERAGGGDGDAAARPRFPRDGFPERRKAKGFGFWLAGSRRRRGHLRARRAHDILVRGDRQGRDLREHELVLEEAPFAGSALAFLEPRLDEVEHRLGHDRALQPEVGDFGPVQAVVLEDGDVHHGGEHQRQRRGAREPALGLHQEHGQGHHPDDEHDDREVEPEGVGVVVHGFGPGKRVVSRPRSSPATCRSAHEDAANARSSRATRGGREEKARGADGVETTERPRACCVRDVSRNRLSVVTTRRVDHGSFPVARARLDASCGPARPVTSEDSRERFRVLPRLGLLGRDYDRSWPRGSRRPRGRENS